MPSLPDLLRMLADLVDAAWGIRAFVDAFRAADGYFELGAAMRTAAAAVLISSTLLVSMRLTALLVPRAGVLLRWSATLCTGMWLATAGFIVLRELRAFAVGWAMLACTILLAAALRFRPAVVPLGRVARRELRAARALGRCIRRSRYAPFWMFFGGFAALIALRAFVIPPLGWDTITYHGPRAAQWVQTGKFTFDEGVVSFDFYRHFFAGGEVLTAWAMLPFHSDLFVNVASLVQWLGVGLGAWALARALGLREPFASTSASVVMFMPTLQLEVGSGYVELPLMAAMLTGAAAAVTCLRRPHVGTALLCALSLGVAAGIKLPGAPPAVIIAGVLWLRLLPSRAFAPRVKLVTFTVSIALALVPVAPWVIRAWRDTGYPLSPMPASLFGVTLGVASHAMRWYAIRPQLEPFTWEAEKAALLLMFSPLSKLNETLGAMTLLPLLLLPVGLVALLRRQPLAAVALAAAALAPLLSHFSEGMTPIRLLRAQSTSRFLVPTFGLIVPLSLAWCRRQGALAVGYRWLLLAYPITYTVLCSRRGWTDWEHRELVFVALALAFAAGLVVLAMRRDRRLGLGVLALLAMWFCAGLQLRRDETRAVAMARSHALHNMPRFWVDGVPFVDEPDAPRRIAITGGPDRSADKWFYYFYLGRRLQNTVRYIVPTVDGKVAHDGNKGDLRARADKDAWFGRLDRAGISEVVSFPPRSIEQGWMEEQDGRFEKLAGKEDWGLFRIRR